MLLYADLFFSFCLISLMTFGGGYSALPMIQSITVTQRGWMTTKEITDMISISEVTPGVFSLNCSTFVGMKVAGWPGALFSTLGFLFPSIAISLVIAIVFRKVGKNQNVRIVFKVLNACIIAVLLNSAISIFKSAAFPGAGVDWIALVIFAVSFIILLRYKINPILVMVGSGLIGLIVYSL